MRRICPLGATMILIALGIALAHAQVTAQGPQGAQSLSLSPRRTDAASSSLLDPRTDKNGAVLNVLLDWLAKGRSYGVWPKIIVRPDSLIVTTNSVGPQAGDVETGCADRLRANHVPGSRPSVEEMQQILNCNSRSAVVNAVSPHRSIFLPLGTGPRKCTETDLTHGSYRICAAILQQSADSFQMEYEEDSRINGTLVALRVRFAVNLQRDPASSLLAGRIVGCTVKTLAAFTFNPQQPSKMTPFESARLEHCSRDAV